MLQPRGRLLQSDGSCQSAGFAPKGYQVMVKIDLPAKALIEPLMMAKHSVSIIYFDLVRVNLDKDHFTNQVIRNRIPVGTATNRGVFVYFMIFAGKAFHASRMSTESFSFLFKFCG